MWHCIGNWFSTHEWLAIWLEGIALVAIFIWDRIDSNQQHRQTLAQLKATTDQANAALIAANAAKESADLATEIQRPHVGISNVIMGGGTQYFNTTLVVRNFGALAAIDVSVKLDYFVDEAPRHSYIEPSTLQLFPGEIHHVTSQFDSGMPDAGPIRGGERQFKAKVSILYEMYDGRGFEYIAELKYVNTSDQMKMLTSSTSRKA